MQESNWLLYKIFFKPESDKDYADFEVEADRKEEARKHAVADDGDQVGNRKCLGGQKGPKSSLQQDASEEH